MKAKGFSAYQDRDQRVVSGIMTDKGEEEKRLAGVWMGGKL